MTYYVLNNCVFATQPFIDKHDTRVIYTHDKPIGIRSTFICSTDIEKLPKGMKVVVAKFKEDAVMYYDRINDVLICDYLMLAD